MYANGIITGPTGSHSPTSSLLTSPIRPPNSTLFGVDCFSGCQSSSSKKPSSKRKVQSINKMIRKVEQEIINSESHLQQIEQDHTSLPYDVHLGVEMQVSQLPQYFQPQFPQQQQQQQRFESPRHISTISNATGTTNTSMSPRPNQFIQQQRLQFSSAKNNGNNNNNGSIVRNEIQNNDFYAPGFDHSNDSSFISATGTTSAHSLLSTTNFNTQQPQRNHLFFQQHHPSMQAKFQNQPQNFIHQQHQQSQQPQVTQQQRRQSNQQQIFPEQYVTMRELRQILQQQLSLQEANIVTQVSNCLKEKIIPEIKRQVMGEIESRKHESEVQLKRALSDQSDFHELNSKLSHLKQSFERSKEQSLKSGLAFNPTRDQIESKINEINERIGFLEDNVFSQVTIFEHYKADTSQAITDFKDTRRRQGRVESLVETLSNTLIAMEYSMHKNFDAITQKITLLESTEEVPFVTQPDRYERSLISELERNFQSKPIQTGAFNSENSQQKQPPQSSELDNLASGTKQKRAAFQVETQVPYSNEISVNLKQIDVVAGSNSKKQSEEQDQKIPVILNNSYDILPDLKSNNNNNNNKQSTQRNSGIPAYAGGAKASTTNATSSAAFTTPFKPSQIVNESFALQEQKNAFNYDYGQQFSGKNRAQYNSCQSSGVLVQKLGLSKQKSTCKEDNRYIVDSQKSSLNSNQAIESQKERQSQQQQILHSSNKSQIENSNVHESSEISYINKKGLPQIFQFVESTDFEAPDYEYNVNEEQVNDDCCDPAEDLENSHHSSQHNSPLRSIVTPCQSSNQIQFNKSSSKNADAILSSSVKVPFQFQFRNCESNIIEWDQGQQDQQQKSQIQQQSNSNNSSMHQDSKQIGVNSNNLEDFIMNRIADNPAFSHFNHQIL